MVNVEFETVTTIIAGLNPVKIGLETLCSLNASLLTAEGVFSFVIGELNEQNSEFAKNMKYSLIQRINERRNVNLIGLTQYLNFGRKYKAAAVTVDISRLPCKNCLVRQVQMRERQRERDKAFPRRSRIKIQLFTLRRREHGDFERKTSDVGRKIKESNLLYDKSYILFNQEKYYFKQNHETKDAVA
ncbi:uncharacterized protein TNCV_1023601 [Trichonephila clavipes]|nr:uncharacterized protein TNCV_1023601 [Trichonephila clavipes]